MRLFSVRSLIAVFVTVITALFLGVMTFVPANAQGQLTVTLPDGSSPEELFTDTVLAPGSTSEETLLVSQNTDAPVNTGIRFESQSPHGPLHDDAELTVDGLGSTVTVPLGEGLDAQSPFWLGNLSPDDTATVTISVRLPASSGNDTQRERARFRIIVTAQGESGTAPPPTSTPTSTPTETAGDPSGDSDNSSDSDSSAKSSGSSDSSTVADSETAADSDASASEDSAAGADSSDDPGDNLPRTGTNILITVLVAAALLTAGTLALRAARRRGDSAADNG